MRGYVMLESYLRDMAPIDKCIALGVVCLTLVVMAKIVSQMVLVAIRGYPPPEVETRPPCHDDRNLTRLCLKDGYCQTKQECNATVSDLSDEYK